MFKKISILIIFLSISLFLNNNSFAAGTIDKNDFTIPVSTIVPGANSTIVAGDTTATLNKTLGLIIQQMMIRLGSLALIVMTIGGGYMVIYHGQDELLSKGKYIFMSGVIALVVALGSYYMVALLRYILYSGTGT